MKTFKFLFRVILCLAIALPVTAVYAEDIDIYSRPPTATPNAALNPNILIVIDNSANWSSNSQHWPAGKQGESELRAVRTVIGELSEYTNVGLMMFTPSGGDNGRGAYVRFHVRQMTPANKSAFSELIGYSSGCTPGLNSLNGTPNCILNNFDKASEKVATSFADYSAAMLEVFKYFGGYTWPQHAQDDVAGAPVNYRQFGAIPYSGADPNRDPFAFTDASMTMYNSPLNSANSCAKNYIIFIGNGFPNQDTASTYLGPPSLLPAQGVGGDTKQLPMANLSKTTSTQTVLLAEPACGTYTGTTATASLNACNADTTLSTKYPGYSNYVCTPHDTCSAGSTNTDKQPIPSSATNTTACGVYATQAACEAALASSYPSYTSHSCEAETACTASYNNPSNPVAASTGYIANDLSVTANCAAYGTANYPGYSGFSCTLLGTKGVIGTTACISNNLSAQASCDSYASTTAPFSSYGGFTCAASNCVPSVGGSKTWQISSSYKNWRIDATTKLVSGKTYSTFGFTTTTTTNTSFSQYISGTKTITAYTPVGTSSAPTSINHFDEWAKFLNQTDVNAAPGKQSLTTFTIDVFKDAPDEEETKLLISAAQAGGGKYFMASDENAITNALRKIFSEIQSVNSVFASSSLPVSVNTQGTYLNQVFMGMFRPEGGASPRWPGNLKQYKFKIFNGVLRLADKYGDQAISSTTGFVTPCADSFWTTDTGQYWNFGGSLALGGCNAQNSDFPVAGSTSVYSDGPDGEVVEKGGAAQQLRGAYSSAGVLTSSSTRYAVCGAGQTPSNTACRKLLTCDGSSAISCAPSGTNPSGFTDFVTGNTAIDAAALNLPDATTRDSLISWTRGQDVDNENANLDASLASIIDEMRPSVHGGVVHSQPAVIDYGSPIGTIAFYGADDGVFHAVDGGQADTDGIELWGFIAPETTKKLNRLRTTSPPIAFPGVSGSPAPTPKDYFFDGSIGVYQYVAPVTNIQTVWIYSSMRRGGRSIYAFNVSDPANPVLKWRKGCFTSDTANDSMCSDDVNFPGEWTKIGQTWSHPTITYISGYVDGSNKQKPVLIFGGGYDQCEDTNSQTRCAGARKGANIWFVDADTGGIIRTYPTHYSVSGDLAEVRDNNGLLTHVYASDTGGNVYRINVGTSNASGTILSSWSNNTTPSQIIIASLSETNHSRKFLNGPSIVPTANYNAVLVGSGDREHPLVTDYGCNNYSTTAGNFVTNQFYMLIDKPAAGYPSPTVQATDLVNVTSGTTTNATVSGVLTITNTSSGGVVTSSTKGWRFNLGPCEQTVNEALTIAGVTYFGSNAPSPTTGTSCTANLGIARGYAVDFLNANPIPAGYASGSGGGSGSGSGTGTASSNPDVGPGAIGEVINGVIAGANGGARSGEYIGGGMPPSPVAGVVDVDGTRVPFCIGCIDTSAANSSALEGGEIKINPPGNRHRSYWYMEGD